MPSWLLSVLGVVTDPIKAVYSWITKIIGAIYTYIKRWIDHFTAELHGLWTSTVALYHQARAFAESVWTYAKYIVDVVIHNVITWTRGIVDDVTRYAHDVYDFAAKWIDWLHQWIDKQISDMTNWVMQKIWQPLHDVLTTAVHWITHEGAYVWDLVTHPDKLMKVIGSYLWQSWMDLVKQNAQPIAAWLIRTMPNQASAFADVLERIIESLL